MLEVQYFLIFEIELGLCLNLVLLQLSILFVLDSLKSFFFQKIVLDKLIVLGLEFGDFGFQIS